METRQLSESLKTVLATMADDYIKLSCGNNGHAATLVHVLDAMFIRHGMISSGVSETFFIPYGVSIDDHCESISKYIGVILKEMGLGRITIYAGSIFIHSKDHVVGLISFNTASTYIGVKIRSIENLGNDIINALTEKYDHDAPPVVKRIIPGIPHGILNSLDVTLPPYSPPADIQLLYPHFNETPTDIWKAFKESSSNVMLLIGSPGLGKSSFIRAMLEVRGWADHDTYIADRTDVLMSPGLSDFIRTLPRKSLVVTEDSDDVVAKREDGNSNMAALLNASSGIIPTDTKIIISTNLSSLRKVDEALLRPGRMFRVLEFKHLNIEQGHAIRDSMQLPDVDFGGVKELTLAEAINWHEVGGVINKAATIGYS